MTDEDEKLILEWCGLSPIEKRWGFWDYCEQFNETQSKFTSETHAFRVQALCYLAEKNDYFEDWQLVPELDLNFYFKYAVPKLQEIGLNIHIHLVAGRRVKVVVSNAYKTYLVTNDDPAEAFGNVLVKLIKEKYEHQKD